MRQIVHEFSVKKKGSGGPKTATPINRYLVARQSKWRFCKRVLGERDRRAYTLMVS